MLFLKIKICSSSVTQKMESASPFTLMPLEKELIYLIFSLANQIDLAL